MPELYLPPHVTQRTGTPCQFSNCWAAVGAWLANGASGGTVKLTPEEFKQRAGGGSGKPNPVTGCATGFEQDLVHGLNVLGLDVSTMTVRYGDIRERVATPRRALFAVALDYDAYPVEKDCMHGQAGPDVNHMVGLVPGLSGGQVQTMNPLCEDYQQVSMTAIEKAAAKFSRAMGRDGIRLIRVVRPVPPALDDLHKEILTLTEQRDALRDYAAAMRQRASDMMDVEMPR